MLHFIYQNDFKFSLSIITFIYQYVLFCFFLKKFWKTQVLFVGPLIPLIWTSGHLLKARVGSLIHTWQRHMCHMFPEIHLWCETYRPLGGQHGSLAILIHVPARRHWWGLKLGSIMLQTNALLTDLCWFGIFQYVKHVKMNICDANFSDVKNLINKDLCWMSKVK